MNNKGNIILREAREKLGFTQMQIAKKAGTTERNYRRIEKGVQIPNTITACLLAEALESTVEKLFPVNNYLRK